MTTFIRFLTRLATPPSILGVTMLAAVAVGRQLLRINADIAIGALPGMPPAERRDLLERCDRVLERADIQLEHPGRQVAAASEMSAFALRRLDEAAMALRVAEGDTALALALADAPDEIFERFGLRRATISVDLDRVIDLRSAGRQAASGQR